jgi:hypothetical protein
MLSFAMHGERLEVLEPQIQLELVRSARNWQPNMKERAHLQEMLDALPATGSPSLPRLRWVVDHTN